ncbi:MAG: heavy-metal-associated domain-containing protein [Candidatus Electryoneaceae bacterium]|nr:heavy-metal-associated domain-containing protein [Candidatus Electryoneaceae bacterium]
MTVPKWIIPILVTISLIGGYHFRLAFTQPTTSVVLSSQDATATEGVKMVCTVQGLKCQGTARFFTSLFNDIPGINSIETYGSEHQAVLNYDPNVITPDEIKAIIEQTIQLRNGSSRQVFQCLSMK